MALPHSLQIEQTTLPPSPLLPFPAEHWTPAGQMLNRNANTAEEGRGRGDRSAGSPSDPTLDVAPHGAQEVA